MSKQLFAPWRDENAKRSYPLIGQQALLGDAVEPLPEGLLLDAAIHPPGLLSPAYLESIEIEQNVQITFSIADTSTSSVVARGSWPAATAEHVDVVELYVPETELPAGLLVISPAVATQLLRQPSRQINFDEFEGQFVVDVCDFIDAETTNDSVEGQLLNTAGDVYLVGENGVQFAAEAGTSRHQGKPISVTVLRPHAMGDPLAKRRLCEGENFSPKRYITEIVFQKGNKTHICKPSGLGEIFLIATNLDGGASALQVYADRDGISFGIIGAGTRGLS